MNCSRCRTKNPNDAKFCSVCGKSFIRNRDENKRNKIVSDITFGTKVCKKCGWLNTSGSIFCEKCGGELGQSYSNENEKKEVISAFPVSNNASTKNSTWSSVVTPLAMITSYVLGILTSKIL